MISLLFVTASLASEIPLKPEPPEKLATECATVLPLSLGQKVPEGLVNEAGMLKCGAIAVPTSEYADLLSIEVWADQLYAQAKVDVLELGWYRTKELKWWQQPNVQRAVGFIEATAILGASAWLYNGLEN